MIVIAKSKRGRRIYQNKNGELTIEDVIKIKQNNQESEWMSKFRVSECKCPPIELRMSQCFYCSDCWTNTFKQVQEYKTYYKILGRKYDKYE